MVELNRVKVNSMLAGVPHRWRHLTIFAVVSVMLGVISILAFRMFEVVPLGDFTITFYRSGIYLLRGENVYVNAYPHPVIGREYPPFNPIWILYVFVPLSSLPLHIAESLRFLMDLVGLPLLAFLCMRWAHLKNAWLGVLLVLAPWHLTQIYGGQLTGLVLLGTLLCYFALRRPNAFMMAIGLWLLLSKPNIVALVVLAAVVFAWRNKILTKALAVLFGIVVLSSLAQPSWGLDLVKLYFDRLAHPRLADSVLLLPGYPWAQIALLAIGASLLLGYIYLSRVTRPSRWLWAVLVCVSLIGAPHTFLYDWQLLMIPIALLLQNRSGIVTTLAVYAYPFLWAIMSFVLEIRVPTASILPSVILAAVVIWRIRANNSRQDLQPVVQPEVYG